MRQTLSTLVAVALLIGLGALAVLALPNGQVALNPAPAAVAAQAAAGPEGVAAMNKFNAIALPLDVQSAWAASGYPFNAQGLAQYIGVSSVSQVLQLNANLQGYDIWYPASGFGFFNGAFTTTPWPLQTGRAYRVVLNANDPTLKVLSLVGNVPNPGAITFSLVGGSPGCKFNDIMVPLDQSSLTNANQLATSMGGAANVAQVLRLNASLQGYDTWLPGSGFGFVDGAFTTTPFPVQIGYPYVVCLKSGANGMPWP